MTPIDPTSPAIAQLRLGGVLLPGVIPPDGISGWERKTSWSIKKGKGSDGASMTNDGDEPPKGKVKLVMWTEAQLAEFNEVYQTLRAAREAGTALDILQPIINALEVSSVVIESISQVTYSAGGLWTVELGLLQWLPEPKKSPKSPNGSASSKNGGNSGSPEGNGEGSQTPPGDAATEETEAEREFADLAEEAGFL